MKLACLAAVALLPLSRAARAADGVCGAWYDAEQTGALAALSLSELSGLAASPTQDGLLWGHNDSGDGALLYAIGLDGADQGALSVAGASNRDWEDIAWGPCQDTGCACLYIADTGDAKGKSDTGVVYRISEPDLSLGADRTAKAEALHFRYPSGEWDAEALFVDPSTAQLYLITKVKSGAASVYRFPDAPPAPAKKKSPTVLEKVGTLDLSALGATDGAITGADASPGGRQLAVRSDTDVFVFTRPEGGDLADALSSTPLHLSIPTAVNGEALAFTPDGQSLILGEEGRGAALWTLRCASFTEDTAAPTPPALCAADPAGCSCAAVPASASLSAASIVIVALRRRSLRGRA